MILDYSDHTNQFKNDQGVYDIDPPVPSGATIFHESLTAVSNVDDVSFDMQVKTKPAKKGHRSSPVTTRSKSMSPQKHSTPIKNANLTQNFENTQEKKSAAKMIVTRPGSGSKKKPKKGRKSAVSSDLEFKNAMKTVLNAPIGECNFYRTVFYRSFLLRKLKLTKLEEYCHYESLKWLAEHTFELNKKKNHNVSKYLTEMADESSLYPRLKVILKDPSYRGDVKDGLLFHTSQVIGNICSGAEKIARRIIEENVHIDMLEVLDEEQDHLIPSWRVRQVLFWGVRDLRNSFSFKKFET